jgi:uncharacterized protein
MRIIDSETHPISPNGVEDCYPMDEVWRYPYIPGALPKIRQVVGQALAENRWDDLTSELLREMDQHGVEKAVIMRGAFPARNADLAAIVKQHPNRFVGFAGWDLAAATGSPPHETWESLDALERGFRDHGFLGAGKFELGRFSPIPPDQAWMGYIPTLELCRKYHKPIMFHTSYDGSPTPIRYKDPLMFEPLAGEYPDVPVLIAHMGKYDLTYFEAAMILARRRRNVYLTTSNTRREFIERAVEEIGAERLIFGSDWSMQHGIVGGKKGFDVYTHNLGRAGREDQRKRESADTRREPGASVGDFRFRLGRFRQEHAGANLFLDQAPDVVHDLRKFRTALYAESPRPRKVDRDNLLDPSRPHGQHDNPVGQEYGLVNLVRHEQNRLSLRLIPDLQQLGLHQLPGLCVERGEGLVH